MLCDVLCVVVTFNNLPEIRASAQQKMAQIEPLPDESPEGRRKTRIQIIKKSIEGKELTYRELYTLIHNEYPELVHRTIREYIRTLTGVS